MSDVTCGHCGRTCADWLMSTHWCSWEVWEGDGEPRYRHMIEASSSADAATSYAFHRGDRDRILCRYSDAWLIVNVRRKGVTVIERFEIRGHYQPTYQVFRR